MIGAVWRRWEPRTSSMTPFFLLVLERSRVAAALKNKPEFSYTMWVFYSDLNDPLQTEVQVGSNVIFLIASKNISPRFLILE